MNLSLANFFISIAGVIIMILLGIIAYFLKQWIESTSKQWIDSTSALTKAVNELKTTVAIISTNQGASDKACANTHQVINNRLNDHSRRLNEHGEAIIELQTVNSRKKPQRQQPEQS